MAKAKTTLGTVKAAVVDATVVVAQAADAHVVQPVGQALGLAAAPPAAKPGRAKRAAARRPTKESAKPTLKAATAKGAKANKPAAKGSGAATMSRGMGATPKPKKAGGPQGRVSGQSGK